MYNIGNVSTTDSFDMPVLTNFSCLPYTFWLQCTFVHVCTYIYVDIFYRLICSLSVRLANSVSTLLELTASAVDFVYLCSNVFSAFECFRLLDYLYKSVYRPV